MKEVCNTISDEFTCKLSNIWANINDKDCGNRVHVHPNSSISGTIYLQTDENSGKIVFLNEDSPMKHYNFHAGDNSNLFYKNVSYQPKNGMIIFFPSWIPHYVETSRSEMPRISMSFNLMQFNAKI